MYNYKQFEDNLRLVVNYSPSVKSVACGVFVLVGSSNEKASENGLSHFIEHMSFKGTQRRKAEDIVNDIEKYGGMVNAYTSKLVTAYYAKCLDEYLDETLDVLADITQNSIYDKNEFEKERNVILKELDMSNDDNEDLCMDMLDSLSFKGSPMARTILGPKKNLLYFATEDLTAYKKKYYTSGNVCLVMSGNVTFEKAEELARKYFVNKYPFSRRHRLLQAKATPERSELYKFKNIEQNNIAFSFKGFEYEAEESISSTVANYILGGSMTSRLFKSVREELGLCYNIYSSASSFPKAGSTEIYLGTAKEHISLAVSTVKKELDKFISDGVSEEEFSRAKAVIKSNAVFAQEGNLNVMKTVGRLMAKSNDIPDPDKDIEKIEAVTLDEVNSVIMKMFDMNTLCVSYVGKKIEKNLLDAFA